ncbi:hypothetical protein PGB90_003689 [Kerria lacca]
MNAGKEILSFQEEERRNIFRNNLVLTNCTSSPPNLLEIPGCEKLYSFNKFTEVMKDFIINDWVEECQIGFFEKLRDDAVFWLTVDRDFISIFVLFICGYCTPVSVSISARNDFEKKYGKVVHVSAIFRHGDRTPWMLYPRDPYQIYSWPDGLQQLTKKGKQRLYNLGKWFRKRYKKFFDPYISHTNIRIDSSDTDRTIMSAQCFLAGFYPPTKKDRLDKKLLWQPLPVHSIPRKYDNIILHSQECNKYNYYLKKVYNSSKMKKIYDRNKKTIDYLEKYTGFHFSKNQLLNVAYNLYVVYDSLLVESENNLKLPTWSKKVYPEPLKNLINLFDGVEFSLHIAKKLIAGPLLKSIIDDMVNKVKNNSTQKFHFYSGHDWSIFTIMKSLLVHKDHFPPYGASILFELREKTNKYFVTVFYKNSTNTSPHLLQIRHCKPPCKLKNFLRITRNLIPLDWESECQLKDNVTVELRETRMGKIEKFATDTLEKKYGKIIRASILFRHGNRTPIQTYPTDPYQNYSWPNGLGQLTKTGEQAEYELGKWFNKRYEFFIRSNLTYRHLKMDSSDIDRTIMSAQLFLAGFFPPRKLEKINIKLLWRPIPVHTIASEIDNVKYSKRYSLVTLVFDLQCTEIKEMMLLQKHQLSVVYE